MEAQIPDTSKYSREFYSGLNHESSQSARVIARWAMERFKPNSVIDVGCGTCAFLDAFLEFGAKSVLGVEGEWAQEFNTSRKDVLFRNLTTELFLYRKFDICLSLEVAEHIPKEFADVFIKNLVNASDIIIFSAAIPGQGGTNHVNLQYPNYWSAKFREMGFSLLEDPRKSIPGRHKLAPWYRQNLLVYSRTDSANMQSQNIVPTTIRDPLIFPNKWSPKFYVYRLLRKLHSRSPGE